MLHIVAICHIAVDMLHIAAICHIAVNTSNRSKICPYKMKKIFQTNGAPYGYITKTKWLSANLILMYLKLIIV